jgi:alanine or glycine:cation symporter, AGCS family
MFSFIPQLLTGISGFLWGAPLICALLGTGIFLTIRLRFIQFVHLRRALRMIFIPPHDKSKPGEISHFQALMTALAATVGTGNIAGVAAAIALGGPGALFWMWMTGLLGMATKYSEALLAVRYRVVHADGTVSGGPMYYIENGVKSKLLAVMFALCAAVATFGIGNMVQSNSVAESLNGAFGFSHLITGLVMAVLAAFVIIGGIRSIAVASEVIVPVMIVGYVSAGIVAIASHAQLIPQAFGAVFYHSFTGQAAFGGVAGAGVREAMRYGLARGLFSNESGMGSSPIAAAAARTGHPVTQALVSMTQTFIDTIIVCTLTGLVIIIAGMAGNGETGAKLTATSFNSLLGEPYGSYVTSLGLSLFAFSTILGWCYYGEKSVEYLLGPRAVFMYRIVYVVMVFFGAVIKLETIWTFADVMNALMALPNLIALVLLSNEIVRIHRSYFSAAEHDTATIENPAAE